MIVAQVQAPVLRRAVVERAGEALAQTLAQGQRDVVREAQVQMS